MFGEKIKGLKYYRDLSDQLEKDIEILNDSYDNYQEAMRLNASKPTNLQNIKNQFVKFCQDEGLCKEFDEKEVKSAIDDRVKFLEEQKKNYDRMIELHSELEKCKNGKLSEGSVEKIKQELKTSKYVEGTKEYNEQLEKRTKAGIKEHEKNTKLNMEKVNEELSKTKKENNFGKVVRSAFGPVGDFFHNNVRVPINRVNCWLREPKVPNRIVNFVVKVGLSLGGLALANMIPVSFLAGVPFVLASGTGLYALGASIINTFRKEGPKKLSLRETKTSLKESWFRFRKSRGKGNMSHEKAFFQDKFKKIKKGGTREAEDEKEDEAEKGTPEAKKEHDPARRTPKAPDATPADPTPVLEPLKEVVQVNSIEEAKNLYERLMANGGCKTLNDWKSLKNAQEYLANEMVDLANIGSGIYGLTDAEKEVNKEIDELSQLNNKFKELVKVENDVISNLRNKISLSLSETIEINSLEDAEKLHQRFMKAGGIKTKEDYESCINAYNCLKSLHGNDEKEEKRIKELKSIYFNRLQKINEKHKDGKISLDGQLNDIYEFIRLDSDSFKPELSEFEKKNLTPEQKKRVLERRSEELKQKLNKLREVACNVKFNQVVSMFDNCDDYDELENAVSDFIARAGKTISVEQINELEFLLGSKKRVVVEPRKEEEPEKSK